MKFKFKKPNWMAVLIGWFISQVLVCIIDAKLKAYVLSKTNKTDEDKSKSEPIDVEATEKED